MRENQYGIWKGSEAGLPSIQSVRGLAWSGRFRLDYAGLRIWSEFHR